MFGEPKEVCPSKEQPEENTEMIIERVETDEDVNELIEYDDTVEELVDEDWTEIRNDDNFSALPEKQSRKPHSARKQGAERNVHQCECGLNFSSSHRLRNHIRVRHEFVPESELLPCDICGKK